MNEYLLLTPGPLTTSKTVKEAMLKDWCTWDDDYNKHVVQEIRHKLVKLATKSSDFTSVLIQGSGTASVESVIGSIIKPSEKLLVINNGAYGKRIAQIAKYLKIDHTLLSFKEAQIPDLLQIQNVLEQDKAITHVAMVHCETTTGILNPVAAISELVKSYDKTFILDAMSSFGGIDMDIDDLGIDILISSANKCIQGVPGFGFVILKQDIIKNSKGIARSLSLDLYDQWHTMEQHNGKWRFTSPTHVVRAFYQALLELEKEGGIKARQARYAKNQRLLISGMEGLGFKCLIAHENQSPIISCFYSPEHPDYEFSTFYHSLKQQGFVIYPGKVSNADCFRIGNIGEIYPDDISRLIEVINKSCYWLK